MEFIGRKNKIEILNNLYNTENYEGILMHGRRRIGKSELIKESLKISLIKRYILNVKKLVKNLIFLI